MPASLASFTATRKWVKARNFFNSSETDTRSSVRAGHAPPDGPELGTPDLLLSLVDVAEALAKVEVGGRLVRHVLDLDERGVLVLVAEAALVAKDGTLDVQPARARFSQIRDIMRISGYTPAHNVA